MNKRKSPTSGKRQGLVKDFRESNSSTKQKKPKGINHLSTLNDIANKWVQKRYYPTLGRALRALIGGDL